MPQKIIDDRLEINTETIMDHYHGALQEVIEAQVDKALAQIGMNFPKNATLEDYKKLSMNLAAKDKKMMVAIVTLWPKDDITGRSIHKFIFAEITPIWETPDHFQQVILHKTPVKIDSKAQWEISDFSKVWGGTAKA